MALNDDFVASQVLTTTEMNNIPRGWVTGAGTASTQASIGTSATDLTSLTVTFTAVATRRYRVTASVNFRKITSSGIVFIEIVNGSTVLRRMPSNTLASNNYGSMEFHVDQVPGAGSVTYKLRGYTTADTFTLNELGVAEITSRIDVDDMGCT